MPTPEYDPHNFTDFNHFRGFVLSQMRMLKRNPENHTVLDLSGLKIDNKPLNDGQFKFLVDNLFHANFQNLQKINLGNNAFTSAQLKYLSDHLSLLLKNENLELRSVTFSENVIAPQTELTRILNKKQKIYGQIQKLFDDNFRLKMRDTTNAALFKLAHPSSDIPSIETIQSTITTEITRLTQEKMAKESNNTLTPDMISKYDIELKALKALRNDAQFKHNLKELGKLESQYNDIFIQQEQHKQSLAHLEAIKKSLNPNAQRYSRDKKASANQEQREIEERDEIYNQQIALWKKNRNEVVNFEVAGVRLWNRAQHEEQRKKQDPKSKTKTPAQIPEDKLTQELINYITLREKEFAKRQAAEKKSRFLVGMSAKDIRLRINLAYETLGRLTKTPKPTTDEILTILRNSQIKDKEIATSSDSTWHRMTGSTGQLTKILSSHEQIIAKLPKKPELQTQTSTASGQILSRPNVKAPEVQSQIPTPIPVPTPEPVPPPISIPTETTALPRKNLSPEEMAERKREREREKKEQAEDDEFSRDIAERLASVEAMRPPELWTLESRPTTPNFNTASTTASNASETEFSPDRPLSPDRPVTASTNALTSTAAKASVTEPMTLEKLQSSIQQEIQNTSESIINMPWSRTATQDIRTLTANKKLLEDFNVFLQDMPNIASDDIYDRVQKFTNSHPNILPGKATFKTICADFAKFINDFSNYPKAKEGVSTYRPDM